MDEIRQSLVVHLLFHCFLALSLVFRLHLGFDTFRQVEQLSVQEVAFLFGSLDVVFNLVKIILLDFRNLMFHI